MSADLFHSIDNLDALELPDRSLHPAFDPEFLVRLELDNLSDSERQVFLKHLDSCPECLNLTADLIQNGILFEEALPKEEALPEEKKSTNQPPVVSVVSPKKSLGRFRRILITVAVLALIVVCLSPFWSSPKNSVARKNLETILTPKDREFSFLLTQYGYDPGGRSTSKGLIIPGQHEATVHLAYENLLKEQGTDENRLEYVRWLLYVGHDIQKARIIFNEIQNQESQEALALDGLISFEERNDSKAQTSFEKYLEKDPHQWQINYNLAVSLFRQGQEERARTILRSIDTQIDSPDIRATIERFLKRTTNVEEDDEKPIQDL